MILFISIKTLKDFYLIDDNIDDKYLLPNIVKGMDFIIRPLIGKDKFNELTNEIENGLLTDLNKTLLSRIEPVIAYYVMSEVIYSTAYKLKNRGLEDGSDRFDELVRLSKKYLIDSQHYEQILKSEYACDSTIKEIKTYKSGLYLK